MSKKLTIEVIEQAAKQTGISDEQRRTLLEMLADMTTDMNEEEKPPAVKKQWAILISDPADALKDFKNNLVGWVLQIPEDAAIVTTEERISNAAHAFNSTKRGRLHPVQTIGEAIEYVKAKHFKDAGVWVKTKEPVLMLTTNNEIADTPSILSDADRGIKKMSVTIIKTGERSVTIDGDGIHGAIPRIDRCVETRT